MNQRQSPVRSPRRWISRLPVFALSLLPLVVAGPVGAGASLPTGGRAVAGSATISSSGPSALTINQSTAKAIIDWSSFSIGSGGSVRFDNGSGATLNRVTGSAVSSIDGLLSASGSVYLINPNGVVVGKSGVVNVGGAFVASTLDVSDAAFLAGGDLTFSGASSASVVNLGKVGALGGDVALIAATVENNGSIAAPRGAVGLIAGQGVLMRDQALDGGRFSVLSGGSGTSATNTGAIQAAQAELRAEGGNVYALAGNTGGVIRATGVSAGDGKVFLVADGGQLTVDGTVGAQAASGAGGAIALTGDVVFNNASVDASGSTGGSVSIVARNVISNGAIDVSGHAGAGGSYAASATGAYVETGSASILAGGATAGGSIEVQAGASLFTSGSWSANGGAGAGGAITALANTVTLADADFSATGVRGGAIRVGGDFHGAGDLPAATTTTVNGSSVLDASAAGASGGGSVVVWSSNQTDFFGTAKARGAGRIEVSSGSGLIMGGFADAGLGGQVLFDPKNIVIDSSAGTSTQFQLTDPDAGASGNDNFGGMVTRLPNGNIVVTAINDSLAAAASGAVYLFNGANGSLISTLTGSQANDQVGSGGVTVLTGGNYVIGSPDWANGAAAQAGAVTWASGVSGVAGAVSTTNSLVGSQSGDLVGLNGVVALSGGAYLVLSPNWANGASVSAGAATWAPATGIAGPVSTSNSLTGSQAGDMVGSGGVQLLTNGAYVVISPNWANGAATQAGAVTWASGGAGLTGMVATTNSLTGAQSGDEVGFGGVTALTNGNYVVASPNWANGSASLAGAATWGSGTAGVVGQVSAANSLVGSQSGDQVSVQGIIALTNGNYVVASPFWSNGGATGAGAATFGSGTAGVVGTITTSNSLTGSQTGDNVSSGGITALSNGNYVVASPEWANGTVVDAGAASWGSGTAGVSGAVSTSNSLTGSQAGDFVSSNGVVALTNGAYVVVSPFWANGVVAGAGAATWGAAAGGVAGAVSATNSLVGSQTSDEVGSGRVTALTNGNYVVASPQWANAGAAGAGAATWSSGAAGIVGAVTTSNSLTGSQAGDAVSSGGVVALTGGNYVVDSPNWANAGLVNAGAATWGSGTSGITGAITTANSLVGSHASDMVGIDGVTALTNGNYVVVSEDWANGGAADAGAATWGSGVTGVVGAISASNSLVGSHTNDLVGETGVTALSNGNYVVSSADWDNGAAASAGAITLGDGVHGTSGAVAASNSLVGTQSGQLLQWIGDTTTPNTLIAVSSVTNQVFVSQAGSGTAYAGDPNNLTFGFSSDQTVTITPQSIAAELATGSNVALQADNDITLNSAITVAGSGPSGALTLDAGRSILLNASITTNNGALNLLANAPLSSGVIDAQRDAGAAVISMASDAGVDAGSAAVSITLSRGVGKTNASSGDVTLSAVAGGSVSAVNDGPSAGGVIVGGVVSASSGGVVLSSNGNVVLKSGASVLVGGGGAAILNSGLSGTGSLQFVLGTSDAAGRLQFTGAEGSGQSLVINGQSYGLIYTAAEFQNLPLAAGGLFALARSIDLTGVSWTPIGLDGSGAVLNGGAGFAGAFEGLGNTVGALSINRTGASQLGLFGVNGVGGSIRDVVESGAVVAGAARTGGLVGYNRGTVTNDAVTGTISGATWVGGLVGYNVGTVNAGMFAGAASGTTGVGGLAGYNAGSINVSSASSGAVTGTTYVGGLVGYNDPSGTIFGDTASGATVTGTTDVGGVAGYNGGLVSVSGTSGTVTGSGGAYAVGGAVGYNGSSGTVNGAVASGSVSGATWTGGLVGVNAGAVKGQSFASASVSGTTGVGGLAGYNAGSISLSSASSGAVTGTTYVGGLVGYNDPSGTIFGDTVGGATVTGGTDVGGLAGYNGGLVTVSGTSDTVTGSSGAYAVGGAVGYNGSGGTVNGAVASGAVSGVTWTGGLVGVNAGAVNGQSFASASVSGTTGVGGLAGYNAGSISLSSASSGAVTGTTYVGGLSGFNDTAGTLFGDTASGATVTGTTDVGGAAGYNGGLVSVSGTSDTVTGSGGAYAVGGAVGYNGSSGTVNGAVASGSVSGATWTGGLVGVNAGAVKGQSFASASVSGTTGVGGLAGYNAGSISLSSASSGAVTGTTYVGGLVGYNDPSGTIFGDTVSGATVSGTTDVGGLAGYNGGLVSVSGASDTVTGSSGAYAVGGAVGYNGSGGTVNGAVASGAVSGVTWTGGLVGVNAGVVKGQSFASASVSGTTGVGGLAGYNAGSISLSSASSGAVTGTTYVGGLVGYNDPSGTIANTFALGAVSGSSQVGGLVGTNGGMIVTSYADDTVSGSGLVGGVVGANLSGASVQNVYWDVAVSGAASAAGSASGTLVNVLGVGGSTGRDPLAAASYQGFDFTNIWTITPGVSRPRFK